MARPLETPPLPPAPPAPGGPAALPGWQLITNLALLGMAILALYFGQDILIPFALAVLLSFALGPLVTRLRRLGLPRVPAVLAVVTLAFLALGAFGLLVGSQLGVLAENLPTYQQNIRAKIRSFQSASPSGGIVERTSEMLNELSEELQQSTPAPAQRTADPVAVGHVGDEPITVRIEEPPMTPFQVIESIALPILAPIGTAGIVIVFVIFMLLERESLRDRLIRLLGGGDLSRTTAALNDAAKRVSRYLLMQLVVNSTYGIPMGVGLWLIGVPNALLWGMLAVVLRFVPYVGPVVAALFPLTLSIAVDPGWDMLLWTLALILTLELISNNIIEPWLYGTSTGISTIAIIIAAIFWTALWGPVGLLLSTPLTVCLAVVGRYVPQLGFFDIMLGSEPVLSPEQRLYQRMLASDPDEGEEIAEEFLKERPLAAFYDEVALPALRLAEHDRHRKVLVGERRALVTDSFIEVVADLADHEDLDTADEEVSAARITWSGEPVLCIAGRTGLDRAAAVMLAQLLERRGIGARVLPAEAVSPAGIGSLDLKNVELICLSYLSATAVAQARHVCRRLRRAAPGTRLMVGLWNGQLDESKADDPAAAIGADLVATSLRDAIERIEALAIPPTVTPAAAPLPENEPARLAALAATGLLDTGSEDAFDRITRKVAQAFGVPICLISLVDERRQYWKSTTGLPEDLVKAREAPREHAICSHVVAADQVIVVEDVAKDRRFADDPFLKERGIRFYAGAPLRTAEGLVLGTLCIIDTEPRTISERERALLQLMADEVVAEINRRGERSKAA